jgi:predicted transcriptional regulator of viral defense system
MHDTGKRNFIEVVFPLAADQKGHLTAAQIRQLGFAKPVIAHHVKTGAVIRVHHGVYRLRDYPYELYEHVMAAWLAVGREVAIVSHESALEIHDLSDVIPRAIHLTVPRANRYLSTPRGVRLHTVMERLEPSDTVVREGMRVTSVARTIADCTQLGTGPEQIEMAVAQALQRGITTRQRLESVATGRSRRVRAVIGTALGLVRA